jgi:hypothetical protein
MEISTGHHDHWPHHAYICHLAIRTMANKIHSYHTHILKRKLSLNCALLYKLNDIIKLDNFTFQKSITIFSLHTKLY